MLFYIVGKVVQVRILLISLKILHLFIDVIILHQQSNTGQHEFLVKSSDLVNSFYC